MEYQHGCPTQTFGQGSDVLDGDWISDFESIENQPDKLISIGKSPVSCCDENGDCTRTDSDGECFPYDATYAEAEMICNSHGM